ncbi:deoxyribose-phosphate aldolase [bacterium]|nr:MAG: deoxyribose-phosphate aldolase [bacterium]
MTRSELASFIDHTVLKPDTRAAAIEKLCEEAREYNFAAVCVPARWVSLSTSLLKDSGVLVATVVGFPHGDTLSRAKADETRAAIEAGADEVDMVISVGAALDSDWNYVREDIAAVVEAAGGKAVVKVIFENAYLDQSQIVLACRASMDAGADYVKTSTGFAASGAKVEEVALMRQTVGQALGVKAAGGIRDLSTALAMIEAGASRLGCSASIAIVNSLQD